MDHTGTCHLFLKRFHAFVFYVLHRQIIGPRCKANRFVSHLLSCQIHHPNDYINHYPSDSLTWVRLLKNPFNEGELSFKSACKASLAREFDLFFCFSGRVNAGHNPYVNSSQ